MTEQWWDANRGIVGLEPGPWTGADWPTEGYDGELGAQDWSFDPDEHPFAYSGHTREEWLQLADEMIARWTAWRAHVEALPADAARRP